MAKRKPLVAPGRYLRFVGTRPGRRMAIVRGQDSGRWTDIYHLALIAPWSVFFLGLALIFVGINALFALLFMADPQGLANARPGDFWDAFRFSVQTMGVQSIGSIGTGAITPHSIYVDVIVIVEAFIGILYLGMVTAVMFARFSRPFARVLFSKVAIITPFDGVPTLMFRAANQRGNRILDAAVSVSLARQATSQEGLEMRRFDELALMRAKSPLFALSWTIMHRIDSASPLHGLDLAAMKDRDIEIIILLSGTDETLADVIYARYSYKPLDLRWDHRFVDVLSETPTGQRIVDLHKFHDTEPLVSLPGTR
jgi:inward rectifier potassium channel